MLDGEMTLNRVRPWELLKREQDEACSREFFRLLSLHHYEYASKEIKDRHLPVLHASAYKIVPKPPVVVDPPEPNQCIAVKDIQRTVAAFYKITRLDLCSQRRDGEVMVPRLAAYLLSREFTLKSLPEIGRRFGGRDHTTIISGLKKARRMLEIDKQFSGSVETLRRMISERYA